MSDLPEPSPAEVPSNEGVVELPRPLEYQLDPPPPEKRPSAKDAVKKALAVQKAKSIDESAREAAERGRQRLEGAEQKADEKDRSGKTPTTSEAIKSAQAKLAAANEAKEVAGKPHAVPPPRFSEDAKAAWHGVPESVQGEVHRAVRELESGLERYRASHHSWESVRQYDEIARHNGGSLQQSLAKVVQIEQAFARDPIDGFNRVCQHFGINMHSLATQIASMRPEQFHAYQQQSQVEALQQQLWQMQQQHSQVIEGVTRAHINREVSEFAKSHPRVDELANEIAAELRAGYDLATAYDRAVKLAGPAKPQSARDAYGRPVNPAGQKQISGAPSSGTPSSSSSSKRNHSPTVSEAVRRAMSRVG